MGVLVAGRHIFIPSCNKCILKIVTCMYDGALSCQYEIEKVNN